MQILSTANLKNMKFNTEKTKKLMEYYTERTGKRIEDDAAMTKLDSVPDVKAN